MSVPAPIQQQAYIWPPVKAPQQTVIAKYVDNAFDFGTRMSYFTVSHVYNLYITIVSNWSAILFQKPFSSMLSFVMWVNTWVVLTSFSFVVALLQLLGINTAIQKISERFYQGNSISNWGVPDLIHGKEQDVLEGMQLIAHSENGGFEEFSVRVARASLILSASAYEERPNWEKFVKRLSGPSVIATQAREVCITQKGSLIRIIFFRSVESPHKFVIAVTFKGPSPFVLTEWITNFSMNKVDATEYLWGACHEGFYSKIFLPIPGQESAYRKAINALQKMVAREENQPLEEPMDMEYSLFCTGHSLGAGLASVLYSRLLKAPKDLSLVNDHVKFVGCYTFGAPRIGNFTLHHEVTGHVRKPINRSIRCWRVENSLDFAADIPFGFEEVHSDFSSSSDNSKGFLNYAHIGTLVYLRRSGRAAFEQGPFQIDSLVGLLGWILTKTGFLEKAASAYDFYLSYKQAFWNWDLTSIFLALTPALGDHSPTRYYINLGNYTDKENQDGDSPHHA